MAEPKTSLLQGTLDLLILRALSLGRNHGLGIANRVRQITDGTFDVKPGSLFSALHRLEERGWLSAEWGESETNRRANPYAVALGYGNFPTGCNPRFHLADRRVVLAVGQHQFSGAVDNGHRVVHLALIALQKRDDQGDLEFSCQFG